MKPDWDVVIVGGGFFGCCLALFLKTVCDRVLVLDREPDLLNRASRVNQARVHAGFHYPRSMITAMRSRLLKDRFVRDFPDAVVDDFQMLYALARRRSKVSPSRFAGMFKALDAPFATAPRATAALFDPALIEAVFQCQEFAFDWSVLRDGLHRRMEAQGVTVRTGIEALRIESGDDLALVAASDGRTISADTVFNVTYAGLNSLVLDSGLAPCP